MCSGPSSAYCTNVATPAAIPPSAWSSGFPVSLSLSLASSVSWSRSTAAILCSSVPRCAGAVRAQPGAAAFARSTAAAT